MYVFFLNLVYVESASIAFCEQPPIKSKKWESVFHKLESYISASYHEMANCW